MPGLVPASPDFVARPTGLAGSGTTTQHIIDFSDVLRRLLRARKEGCPTFAAWLPKYKGDLVSAISGGQWPQARIASTRKWTDDNLCQLCKEAVGTLAHRHNCRATKPVGGWQPMPPECIRHSRQCETLFVLKLELPRPPPGYTFRWLLHPPEDLPQDAIWFIDGSLFDEARRFARRMGFGVVVIAAAGTLLAFGKGVPPDWIHDAASAEVWAFFVVSRLACTLPHIITNCLGILQCLQLGFAAATTAKKKLSRA